MMRKILFTLALVAPVAAPAQKLDRATAPKPTRSPTLHVPAWTRSKLSNGAELIVVPKHDLPLVAFNISFVGGTANYETPDKTGEGSFAAQMLSEGTTTKTADQLSDAQQLLGTIISSSIGTESGTIGFTSLKSKLEPALALVADMMLNSTFPDSALERIRGRTLVNLTAARDQPNAIALNVFTKVTFGDVAGARGQ